MAFGCFWLKGFSGEVDVQWTTSQIRICFSFYSIPKCYVCGLNQCVFRGKAIHMLWSQRKHLIYKLLSFVSFNPLFYSLSLITYLCLQQSAFNKHRLVDWIHFTLTNMSHIIIAWLRHTHILVRIWVWNCSIGLWLWGVS